MVQQSRQKPIVSLWNLPKNSGEKIDPRAGSINAFTTESEGLAPDPSDIVVTPIELMECNLEAEINLIGRELVDRSK